MRALVDFFIVHNENVLTLGDNRVLHGKELLSPERLAEFLLVLTPLVILLDS